MDANDLEHKILAFARAIAPRGHLPIVPLLPGKKKPAVKWRDLQTREQHPAEAWRALRRRDTVAWGCILPAASPVAVVDVDDVTQVDPDVLRRYRHEVPTPVRVATGRPEGMHMYYRAPAGAILRTHNKMGGYDFKGACSYVVLPGSWHEKHSRRYALRVDGIEVDPRRFAPGELFARLPVFPIEAHLQDLVNLGRRHDFSGEDGPDEVLDDEEGLRIARRVCAWHARAHGAAVEGAGGHDRLLDLVLYLGDLGVQQDTAHVAIAEWNVNGGAQPPWPRRELAEQVESAYRSRRRPLGCKRTA